MQLFEISIRKKD